MHNTYSSSHSCQLGVGVVCGSDLDDIGGDQVDTLETTDDGAELTGGPATCLGCSGSRCD